MQSGVLRAILPSRGTKKDAWEQMGAIFVRLIISFFYSFLIQLTGVTTDRGGGQSQERLSETEEWPTMSLDDELGVSQGRGKGKERKAKSIPGKGGARAASARELGGVGGCRLRERGAWGDWPGGPSPARAGPCRKAHLAPCRYRGLPAGGGRPRLA